MTDQITIRTIQQSDNAALAGIIRNTLEEFNAHKLGTVYFDKTTDHLSDVFKKERSIYFVAEQDGVIVGGSGVYPTEALPPDTCELVKFYLSPAARGKGTGKELLQRCMQAARDMGYKQMYLETMPELTIAIPLYEKHGFIYLPGALGNSGHTGCDVWMIKDLTR